MAQYSAISKPENKRILEEQSEDTQLSKTIRETHKEGLLGNFSKVERNCYGSEKLKGSVYFCASHPVNPLLVCGLSTGKFIIFKGTSLADSFSQWETLEEGEIQFPKNASAMSTLQWNSNGTILAAGLQDGKLLAWYALDKMPIEGQGKEGCQIWSLTWNPFSPNILATFDNETILIWDMELNEPRVLHAFNKHSNTIRDLSWMSKARFASCSDDGTIKLCGIGQDQSFGKSLEYQSEVTTVLWNSSQDLLASNSRDGSIKIWSLEKDDPVYLWKSESYNRSQCIAWSSQSPDTKYSIASGLQDGTILIWDLLTNHCQFLRGHSCMVWDVNFSLDGRFLASIDQQGQFIIWTTEDWKILFQCTVPYRAFKRCLLWQPGYKIALANSTHEVHMIEYLTASCL